MANRPTANTFNNDVSLLWLLKNSKTIYRSILAQAQADTSQQGLATDSSVEKNISDLRSILLTSEEIKGMMDELELTLNGSISAVSENLGEYKETTNNRIKANANAISQQNDKLMELSTDTYDYIEKIDGQIIRGYIANPDYPTKSTSPYLYGIVIATQVSVYYNSTKADDQENVYYEINTENMPTFGYYTSTGWQFWVGGNRVGWYDSSDGRLHVGKEEVTGDIVMGDWLFTDSGGFGIKYIGG